jgi:hypothetical protein
MSHDYYAQRRLAVIAKVASLRKSTPELPGSIRIDPTAPEVQTHTETEMAPSRPKVVIAMASFPPRKAGLVKRMKELLPQCDVMALYLNGYDEIPPELPPSDKYEIVLAGPNSPNPDITSHGKFHFLDKYQDCMYLCCDDDIVYPKDYTQKMVAAVEKYGRKAFISAHGIRYKLDANGQIPEGGLDKQYKQFYMYDKACKEDTVIHIPGNGVSACFPSAIGMTTAIRKGPIGSGDDGDCGIHCQLNRIPVVRLASTVRWLTADGSVHPIGAQYLNPDCAKLQNEKHRGYPGPWRLYPTVMQKPGQAPDAMITISMPTFNTADKMLLKAVNSVLNQTETRLRLYVVNDSTDNKCWSCLKHITDPRLIRVQMPVNSGTYACHSFVLSQTTTLWWSPFDSDDYAEPTRYATLLANCGDKEVYLGGYADVTGTKCVPRPPLAGPRGSKITPAIRWQTSWAAGLWKTEWVRKAGGINWTFKCGYDSALQTLAIQFSDFGVDKDTGYSYVHHANSLTTAKTTGLMSDYRAKVAAVLNDSLTEACACATIEEAGKIMSAIDMKTLDL